ncbi:hypothetical protein GGX14DRAFT_327610, partial [Mycena pura]
LSQEALAYETLTSLQGSVLPQMVGFFAGDGWMILVTEDCGRSLTDSSLVSLSLQQREMLWRHVCSIHASGVAHHDLGPRNLVVSSSGDVRIIDFAYSELGHQCVEATCEEL